jgi:CO dehydrogenase nickel-insertion accessory protein CooC1
MEDFKKGAGLSLEKEYSDAFFPLTKKRFTLSPLSKEIEKYSFLLPSFIRLMIAGPQTKNVLYGKACSHILTKPLKLLLPLLEIKENEMVLIDEKAGADGVSTGIITGIDVGIIVVEPTLHSIKTAKQISELMDFYETPHIFVANKITSDEDRDFIATELGHEPTMFFMESTSIKRNPFIKVADWRKALETVEKTARKKTQYNRLERTIQKFKRNQAFSQK